VTNTQTATTFEAQGADLDDALDGLTVVDAQRYGGGQNENFVLYLTDFHRHLRMTMRIDTSYAHQGHAKVELYGLDGWHEVASLPGTLMRADRTAGPLEYQLEAWAARLLRLAREVCGV
jgi:hypothetical protein